MEAVGPTDIKGKDKSETVISLFNEMLLKKEPASYYHLVISGEENRTTCNKVQYAFIKAGWSDAICKTSSENGERPGLTGLQLRK